MFLRKGKTTHKREATVKILTQLVPLFDMNDSLKKPLKQSNCIYNTCGSFAFFKTKKKNPSCHRKTLTFHISIINEDIHFKLKSIANYNQSVENDADVAFVKRANLPRILHLLAQGASYCKLLLAPSENWLPYNQLRHGDYFVPSTAYHFRKFNIVVNAESPFSL